MGGHVGGRRDVFRRQCSRPLERLWRAQEAKQYQYYLYAVHEAKERPYHRDSCTLAALVCERTLKDLQLFVLAGKEN